MTKNIFLTISLLLATQFSMAASDLEKTLNTIAENAQIGNGSVEVKHFDLKTFKVEELFANDLAAVKAEYKDCGPFHTEKNRRPAIQVVREIGYDTETADALQALYDQKKILKMYTIHTNNEIECSRMWAQVYTTEGWLLELYYGMND